MRTRKLVIREAFTRATDHLTLGNKNFIKFEYVFKKQSFMFHILFIYYCILASAAKGDPECILLEHWPYVGAKLLQNITKSRELWGNIISLGHSKYAQFWFSYSQFER